jgi:hypothetical protein
VVGPGGGPRFICWAICFCICRIWRGTSVCVAMKASDGVMGGGGGKSPLPFAPSCAWFPPSEMRVLLVT